MSRVYWVVRCGDTYWNGEHEPYYFPDRASAAKFTDRKDAEFYCAHDDDERIVRVRVVPKVPDEVKAWRAIPAFDRQHIRYAFLSPEAALADDTRKALEAAAALLSALGGDS